MDVHQESMAVANIAKAYGAEVVSFGTVGTPQGDLNTLIRPLPSKRAPLVFAYEAGPGGSRLDRSLPPYGSVGGGVAPSQSPKKAGDYVRTDRRQAVPLAWLMHSGDLTPVDAPPGGDEALEDLSRARLVTPRRHAWVGPVVCGMYRRAISAVLQAKTVPNGLFDLLQDVPAEFSRWGRRKASRIQRAYLEAEEDGLHWVVSRYDAAGSFCLQEKWRLAPYPVSHANQ